MKNLYVGYVIREHEQPSLINEYLECESVDDYVDTVVEMIRGCQEVEDHDAEDIIVQKLINHDFDIETDDDFDGDYLVQILVRV